MRRKAVSPKIPLSLLYAGFLQLGMGLTFALKHGMYIQWDSTPGDPLPAAVSWAERLGYRWGLLSTPYSSQAPGKHWDPSGSCRPWACFGVSSRLGSSYGLLQILKWPSWEGVRHSLFKGFRRWRNLPRAKRAKKFFFQKAEFELQTFKLKTPWSIHLTIS